MCVLLSGAILSPERANFGLKQIASDGEREYGSDAANFLWIFFSCGCSLKSMSIQRRMKQYNWFKTAKACERRKEYIYTTIPQLQVNKANGLENINLLQ